jgi:vitamin B12 transporter
MLFPTVAAVVSPSPKPSPTAIPVVATVRVATGSAQTLHRLPFAASALDARQISDSAATSSDALMGALPGFDRDRSNSAFTNYGQLRVSFDGAGSDRGLVFVDGVPAQDGFGGQIDWAAYPVADIARAELLRGPGSALYGAGAVGGVLSIDTLAPATAASSATHAFAIGAGTHAFEQYDIAVAQPLSSRFSTAIFAGYSALRYPDLPPPYASPIDRAAQSEQSIANVRLQYVLGTGSSVSYEYRGAWDAQEEGRPNYAFSRRFVQQDAHYTTHLASGSLEIVPYTRTAFVTNFADQFPQSPGVLRYTQEVPAFEDGATLHWSTSGGISTFDVLADAKFVHGESVQHGPTSAFQSLGSGVQHLAGAGVQETLQGREWEFIVGIHGDLESFFDGELISAKRHGYVHIVPPSLTSRALSPRAAFRYDFTKQLAFRISGGGGLRMPYLNELVRSYRIGATSYLANPNLVPERSASLTGGFDWLGGTQHASIDFFHTIVSDAIAFRTISPSEQIYENIDRTQTDGATFTYSDLVSPNVRVSLSGTSQSARVVAGDQGIIGKRLAYVPESDATFAADGVSGIISLGATVSYLGQTYADDLNTEPLGRAVVAGVHARLPIHPHEQLVLNVQNLTGVRYLSSIDRYAEPMIVSVTLLTR